MNLDDSWQENKALSKKKKKARREWALWATSYFVFSQLLP